MKKPSIPTVKFAILLLSAAIVPATLTTATAQDSANRFYHAATDYANDGEYDKAIALYDKYIAINPTDATAYCNRGLAYYEKGNYDRAIADFHKAIVLNPKSAEAYYNRGLAYYEKGNYDRAIADYDKAIDFNPEDADAYQGRGFAYYQKGDTAQGMLDSDKANELNPPQNADELFKRAEVKYENRNYVGTILDINWFFRDKENKECAAAYFLRGRAHYQNGKNCKIFQWNRKKSYYMLAEMDFRDAIMNDSSNKYNEYEKHRIDANDARNTVSDCVTILLGFIGGGILTIVSNPSKVARWLCQGMAALWRIAKSTARAVTGLLWRGTVALLRITKSTIRVIAGWLWRGVAALWSMTKLTTRAVADWLWRGATALWRGVVAQWR